MTFVVAVCVACGTGFATCAAGASSTLRPLESGAQSGVTERSFRIVSDECAFRQLHRSVHAHRIPLPPPPEVDFDRDIVLAAFLGARSTAGYHAGFGGVDVAGDMARVIVFERSPPAGAVLAQVVTTPYAMAALSRWNLKAVVLVDPSGTVLFRARPPESGEARRTSCVDAFAEEGFAGGATMPETRHRVRYWAAPEFAAGVSIAPIQMEAALSLTRLGLGVALRCESKTGFPGRTSRSSRVGNARRER